MDKKGRYIIASIFIVATIFSFVIVLFSTIDFYTHKTINICLFVCCLIVLCISPAIVYYQNKMSNNG